MRMKDAARGRLHEKRRAQGQRHATVWFRRGVQASLLVHIGHRSHRLHLQLSLRCLPLLSALPISIRCCCAACCAALRLLLLCSRQRRQRLCRLQAGDEFLKTANARRAVRQQWGVMIGGHFSPSSDGCSAACRWQVSKRTARPHARAELLTCTAGQYCAAHESYASRCRPSAGRWRHQTTTTTG